MLRFSLLLSALLTPAAFGADPPEALKKKISEGKAELAKLEKDLATLNASHRADIGEWIYSGDLKIRVAGTELRDVMDIGIEGGPYKTGEKELAIRVEAVPLSKTRRFQFAPRTLGTPPESLTDDRGREYDVSGTSLRSMIGNDDRGFRPNEPNDPVILGTFFFKPPSDDARELQFTLKGVQSGGRDVYRFRIPAVAWALKLKLPEGLGDSITVLEKAIAATEDVAEQKKLRDAVVVLKKMSSPLRFAGPKPTEAQEAFAKKSEDLVARIVTKRDEISGWEIDLAAGEFIGLNEWAVVGGVRVRVTQVRLQNPVFVNATGDMIDQGAPQLLVWFEVENRSKERVTYKRWPMDVSSNAADARTNLSDRYGNRYGNFNFGYTDQWLDGALRHGEQVIGPKDAPLKDVLSFETPLASAGDLWLTLDARQVGEKGSYRFKIPAAAWKPKK